MRPDFFYTKLLSHPEINSIVNIKSQNILYLFTPNVAHIIVERVYISNLFFYSKNVYKHALGGGVHARACVRDMTFLIICILGDMKLVNKNYGGLLNDII